MLSWLRISPRVRGPPAVDRLHPEPPVLDEAPGNRARDVLREALPRGKLEEQLPEILEVLLGLLPLRRTRRSIVPGTVVISIEAFVSTQDILQLLAHRLQVGDGV